MKVLIHEYEHTGSGVAISRGDKHLVVVVTTGTTPAMATRLARRIVTLDERDAIGATAPDRFPGVASEVPLA